jgi:hypothetical protein
VAPGRTVLIVPAHRTEVTELGSAAVDARVVLPLISAAAVPFGVRRTRGH